MTSQQQYNNEGLSIDIEKADDDDRYVDDDIENPEAHSLDDGKEIHGPLIEIRRLIAGFLNNLLTRGIIVLLIFLDIVFVLISVIIAYTKSDATHITSAFDILSLVLIIIFFIELCLRMFVELDTFGKSWYNIIDGIIIVISFLITVILFAINESGTKVDAIKLISIGRFIRLVLLVRSIRLILQSEGLQKGMRICVRGNKRGYQKDGYDLDLCYVTPRVIAMSFPSSGLTGVYRNKIEQVSRFLNEKHKNCYKVYNLCSERDYDTNYFEERVERFMIDDHNVPTLKEAVRFADNVKKWMELNPNNVIAVHCKGGKGRTGTMISMWLLESRQCKTADEALNLFGSRRTDLEKGSTFQGVETPSQSRFVGYYDIITNKLSGVIPERRNVRLDKVIIHSIRGYGNSDGSDLSFIVYFDNKRIGASCNLANNFNCKRVHDADGNKVVITDISCDVLFEEIKIMFQSNNKTVPKYYDECAFFFTIHTSFIDAKTNRLYLSRNELDNPHKSKFWNVYNENFAVELFFKDA